MGQAFKILKLNTKKVELLKIYFKKKKKQKKSEVESIAISHVSIINDYNILEIPCILSKIIGKDPPQCEIAIEGQKCLIELLDEVEESITTDFMYISF